MKLNRAVFNTEMLYIVDVWLGAMSQNNEIRLKLIDNDITTYDDFKCLDKESIYLLDRESQLGELGATTKLERHHAKRVIDTRDYIDFLEENDESAIAANPTKWVKRNFERWKRKGKPAGPNLTTPFELAQHYRQQQQQYLQ